MKQYQCTHCGAFVEKGSHFCTSCGHPLSWEGILDESDDASKKSNLQQSTDPLSFRDYLIMLLLLCIPVVNIVLLFYWGFSAKQNVNKRNFSRAYLVVLAICLVISLILCFSLFFFFRNIIIYEEYRNPGYYEEYYYPYNDYYYYQAPSTETPYLDYLNPSTDAQDDAVVLSLSLSDDLSIYFA